MFAEINKKAIDSLPVALSTVGTSPVQRPESRPNGFPFHQILWVTKGQGRFHFTDRTVVLKAGQGVIYRRYTPHSYDGAPPFQTSWLTFSGGDGFFDYLDLPKYFIFEVPEFLDSAHRDLFRLAEGNSNPLSRSATLYALICDLLGEVFRQDKGLKAQVDRYLEAHYSEPLTLDRIAGAVGKNRFSLCREYGKEAGKGVMDTLFAVRIAKAKRFLMYSNDTVQSIGLLCGFDSPAYFTKRFRETCGCTPSDYRKRKLAGLPDRNETR